MADNTTTYNVDVDIDVKTGKVEGSIAQLKALKKQLKETAAGSDEFKKLYQQIDDLEDKLKGTKKVSADWIDSLEAAGGPIGALGAGLNKLKQSTVSFGAALKATGIGLIVAAVGALAAAFANSDEEMKKFQPLLIGMEKILNGILSALQPLIDGFIQLATEALPYVTKGFQVAYAAITSFLQGIGKLGSAIAKLFKGDFKGAWEDAKSSVTDFGKRYDEAAERFDAGTKKMTKTQKENAKNQKEELLKRLEAQDKYDEALLEKMKQQALAETENEQEKLDVEIAFAKKLYDLKQAELDKRLAAEKKGSAEYKTIQAEKVALDADYIGKTTEFAQQQKKLLEDNLKAQKDFNDKRQAILAAAVSEDTARAKAEREAKYTKDLEDLEADKEFIKLSEEEKFELRDALLRQYNYDLAKIDRDAKIQAYTDELTLLQAQQKTLTEGTKAYLDNSIAIENDAYQIKIANAKGNAKQIEAINIEHEQNLKDIKLKAAIAEKQIQLDRLNVIAGIGNSLAQLAGKNKALAIAAIAIEKAAAIGSIIVNTQIANLKAVAASPLTFGQPWVTINTIAGGLAAAAAIASGIQAVQQINSVQIPGSNASGGSIGGGGSVSMPSAPSVSSAQAPQITGTTGGNNPTTQIAQTLAGATNKPIRAYVVSGDVSSQQALDRRTSKAATF